MRQSLTTVGATIRLLAQRFTWLWSGRFGTAARLVMTALLLYVILSRIDLSQVVVSITELDPLTLLIGLGLNFACWVINTFKWQQLLGAYGIHRPLMPLIRLNLIANFYSKALPGQVTGEVLKAIQLGRPASLRQGVFASIFLDRVTGLIAVTTIGVVTLLLSPPPGQGLTGMAPVLLGLVAMSIAGIAVLALPSVMHGLHTRWSGLAGVMRYVPAFLGFADEQGRRPSIWQLTSALGVATVFQAVVALIAFLIASAVGIDVPPLVFGWIMAVVSLGYLLPISVAGIGVREGTFVALLGLFGISAGQALTTSLVLFAIEMMVGLSGGLLNLFGGGGRLGEQHSTKSTSNEIDPVVEPSSDRLPNSRHAHSLQSHRGSARHMLFRRLR